MSTEKKTFSIIVTARPDVFDAESKNNKTKSNHFPSVIILATILLQGEQTHLKIQLL